MVDKVEPDTVFSSGTMKISLLSASERETRKKLKREAKVLKRAKREAQKIENKIHLDKRPDVRMAAKILQMKNQATEVDALRSDDLIYFSETETIYEGELYVVSLTDRSLTEISLLKSITYSLESVVELDLSYNKLKEIDGLEHLVNIQTLNIRRNDFRNLPTGISKLKHLINLNASRNHLKPTAEFFVLLTKPPLPSLQILDLTFNPKIFTKSMLDLLSELLPLVSVMITVTSPPAPGSYIGDSPADRDPTLLRSQLEPLTTLQLRNRLIQHFGYPAYSNYGESPEGRAKVMTALLDAYAKLSSQRKLVRSLGKIVPPDLIETVRRELEAWSERYDKFQERPMIKASKYMILRSPTEAEEKLIKLGSKRAGAAIRKYQQNTSLWEAAKAAMASVDIEFSRTFTGLAVTKGFKGSPHIDTTNLGPFYGLSIGDFDDGTGGVCVELDPFTVCEVNTKNRLGRIDGRFPHWVAPYDDSKTRFSLIFYLTEGKVIPKTLATFGEIME